MAGTYVDNWSSKYSSNQWVWWTERDAVGIAKFNPNSERFNSPGADQDGKKITIFYYKKDMVHIHDSYKILSYKKMYHFTEVVLIIRPA